MTLHYIVRSGLGWWCSFWWWELTAITVIMISFFDHLTGQVPRLCHPSQFSNSLLKLKRLYPVYKDLKIVLRRDEVCNELWLLWGYAVAELRMKLVCWLWNTGCPFHGDWGPYVKNLPPALSHQPDFFRWALCWIYIVYANIEMTI